MPFFSMIGRQARLPFDIIFGIPHVGRSTTTEEFAHPTRENLQIAFELARRNLSERIDKQKANNSKLPPIPEFTPGQKVLVDKPHHSTDGPNPKLIQPWRGPYIICSKLSPVVYRIRHPDDTKQVSVHLAHIKSCRPHQSAPAPHFHKLERLFLGKTLPTPALKESETVPPHIEVNVPFKVQYQLRDTFFETVITRHLLHGTPSFFFQIGAGSVALLSKLFTRDSATPRLSYSTTSPYKRGFSHL